jgi:hypothetical protein
MKCAKFVGKSFGAHPDEADYKAIQSYGYIHGTQFTSNDEELKKAVLAVGEVYRNKFFDAKKSYLAAAMFIPSDEKAPIIIAFRGTSNLVDGYNDLVIATTKRASKARRDQAYEYYQAIKALFPGKAIILTGHSLGGHIAQDVAIRAYQDEKDKLQVQVRTFNTAPHKKESTNIPIINYALDKDVVSIIPRQPYVGPFFIMGSSGESEGHIEDHLMKPLMKSTPEELKKYPIGCNDKDFLIEQIQAFRVSCIYRENAHTVVLTDDIKTEMKAIQELLIEEKHTAVIEKIKQIKPTYLLIEKFLHRLWGFSLGELTGKSPLASEESSLLSLIEKRRDSVLKVEAKEDEVESAYFISPLVFLDALSTVPAMLYQGLVNLIPEKKRIETSSTEVSLFEFDTEREFDEFLFEELKLKILEKIEELELELKNRFSGFSEETIEYQKLNANTNFMSELKTIIGALNIDDSNSSMKALEKILSKPPEILNEIRGLLSFIWAFVFGKFKTTSQKKMEDLVKFTQFKMTATTNKDANTDVKVPKTLKH